MKYNKGFIALPILIFAAAIAVGVAAYFNGYFGFVVQTDSTSSPQEATNESGWVARSTSSGQFETDVSNWQTYRNEQYGFGFEYPESWGEVEFRETFASDPSPDATRASGFRVPDIGGRFDGRFIENKNCQFGGITTDYSYGSSVGLYDVPGWREENGRYSSLLPDETIRDPKLKYDFTPDDVVAISTGKALVLETKPFIASTPEDENAVYTLEYGLLRALINLPGPIFHGLAVGCLGSSKAGVSPENRQGIYQILSTFKFIP